MNLRSTLWALLLAIPLYASADDGRFDNVSAEGQPDKARLLELSKEGYAAVIDLRGVGENRGIDEASEVEALGMEYVSLPISVKDGLTVDNAKTLAAFIEKFDAPVLVHCGSGNRVGALMALHSNAEGADADASIEVGKAFGLTRLEGRVREIIDASDSE